MKQHILLFASLLLFFATAHAQPAAKSADAVLQQAYKKAAKENKKVFVIFHASWCGWCHKMDSCLNDNSIKKFFDDKYVIVHLTVYESPEKKNLENPGALDLLKKYHGADQGIPYWLVFDSNGNLLADSKMRAAGEAGSTAPGSNVGCPAKDDEVNYFIKILQQTSNLNDQQLAVIAARFTKNNE